MRVSVIYLRLYNLTKCCFVQNYNFSNIYLKQLYKDFVTYVTISIKYRSNNKVQIMKTPLLSTNNKQLLTQLRQATLLSILFFSFVSGAFAQRKSSKDNYEPKEFLDRIYVGAYLNSPFIGGSTNGSVFQVGIQPFAGYKWNEFFSTGLTIKYDYTYIWFPGVSGQRTSLNNFSSTTFTRLTLAERFIIQLEGGFFSFEERVSAFETERRNFPVVYAGIGYTQNTYELLLTYELYGQLGFYQIPLDYKIGLVRHF